MKHSDFFAEIIGHIDGDIREIKLRDGLGCSFRLLTLRPTYDQYGVPSTKPMWLPVLTFDTTLTLRIMREFARGSFVRLTSRELRLAPPREANGKLYNNVSFIIESVEDARVELPAEAGVVAGVTV